MRGSGEKIGVALLIAGILIAGLFIWVGQRGLQFSPTSCNNNEDQLILKLSSDSNAHAETWDSKGFQNPVDICFDSYFRKKGSGNRNEKIVLRLSGATNAHAEDPDKNPPNYNTPVKYDDLSCVLKNTDEVCGEIGGNPAVAILLLSDKTNAHLALPGKANYPYKLCCSGGAPPKEPVCGNGFCEQGENENNCPKDCGGGAVPLVSLDFQGEGHPLAEGWTEVTPGGGAKYRWASGQISEGICPEGSCPYENSLPEPKNAARDFHKVEGSTFVIDLDNENELEFSISIKYGSAVEASAPFSVKVNGADFGSGEAKEIGQFGSLSKDVSASNKLTIDFEHPGGPIAISGIVVGAYCGNGKVEEEFGEQCDGGENCDEFCQTEGGGGGGEFCGLYDPYNKENPKGGDFECTAEVPVVELCDEYNEFTNDYNLGCAKNKGYEKTLEEFKKSSCESDCAGAHFNEKEGYQCRWDNERGCESALIRGGTECRLEYEYLTDCKGDEAFRDVNITVINVNGGSIKECAGPCGDERSCVKQIQCPKVIGLPFFDWSNFVVALAVIGFIYLFIYRKKEVK